MKKKLSIIISIVVTLYAAIFIAVMLITIYLPSMFYDNPNLIIKNINSANKNNYRKGTQDGITTITCGKMTGVDTIWKFKADEDITLQMYYNLEVTKGKAKLVLITPDDSIITLAEQDSNAAKKDMLEIESDKKENFSAITANAESVTDLNLKKGENRIKIICEKGTTFSLSFKIQD